MDPSPPPHGPVTSTTLLEGLRDPEDRSAWRDWVGRYRPLLVRYATRLGVPEADAEDVAQAALLSFSSAYRKGRYERARGRLSSWLFGFARNEVRRWARVPAARAAGATEAERALAASATDGELEELWEREWRDAVVAECLRLVRRELEPRTLRAFELFALAERPAGEVARELGLSENAVFGAKRRVLERIRELLPWVEDAW